MSAPWRPFLVLVTDRRRVAPDARTARDESNALTEFLLTAVAAAVPLIQIREPGLPTAWLCDVASRVREAASGTATRVVINDRADVAWAAGADGLHLKATGPAVARMRQACPASWLIGRSAHDSTELGQTTGADYVVFGTVFETASKPGVHPNGLAALSAAAATSSAPVVAIGGVTPERMALCAAAGAAGVAGISFLLPPASGPSMAEVVQQARYVFLVD